MFGAGESARPATTPSITPYLSDENMSLLRAADTNSASLPDDNDNDNDDDDYDDYDDDDTKDIS